MNNMTKTWLLLAEAFWQQGVRHEEKSELEAADECYVLADMCIEKSKKSLQ